MFKINKIITATNIILFLGITPFFAVAQTGGTNPIYWVDNSAFSMSDIADRGYRAVLSAVGNQRGSIVTSNPTWNKISNQSQLLGNVTGQLSKIPSGSVVVLRYTGHGATSGFTPGNGSLISRADYLNHVYNEAVKNDLHVIMIDEDCYGQRLCAPIMQQHLEDGRISILTGSKGPNVKTDGESGANYYARIIANQAAIDTNKDGKVTYGEWEKWAKERNELGSIGHIGGPDAVLFHRSDVTPYDTKLCIHPKPGQDEGDGFGPMFGNEDVYDPDTQLNILGENIEQIKARGLIPKQEGTDGKEGNYAARKNAMGHLRDNFPKHEKLSHKGDEDELDAGKGPSSNYQTAKDDAMKGKESKEVKLFYSSGGYNKPLTAQQMMESVRAGNRAYKAHNSDIAVQPRNTYNIGGSFPLDESKTTGQDAWIKVEQDGEEGCKFRRLTDEEKTQLLTPPAPGFPGGNGGGGGGGGGGDIMGQLMDTLKNMLGQQQQPQQPQQTSQPYPQNYQTTADCPPGLTAYCTKEGLSVCLENYIDLSKTPDIARQGACEETGIQNSPQPARNSDANSLANLLTQAAESGIPKALLENVVVTIIGMIKDFYIKGS